MGGGKKEVAFTDHHGNAVDLFRSDPGVTTIEVLAVGEVETTDVSGVYGATTGFAPLWLFRRPTELTAAGPQVSSLVDEVATVTDQASPVALLHALLDRVRQQVTYTAGVTDSFSSAESVIAAGHGVCQDHAHVFLAASRKLGFPARYVSGYLMMTDRVDQDASHAWAEVWINHLGWVGFDVSNGISPDERYVKVATGTDYSDAAPISGIRFGQGSEELHVSVQVQQ